ncbi:MAG: O-antigen ligase family protein [Candidatus Saganbacteria bacterium]|nr:O-antigen ligase family protein [Candidatus Saganbacteria bacterium]
MSKIWESIKKSFFYLWVVSIPILSVSPWQGLGFSRLSMGMLFVLICFFAVLFNLNEIKRWKQLLAANKTLDVLMIIFILWNFISLFFNWNLISVPSFMKGATGFKGPYFYNLFFVAYLLFNMVLLIFIRLLVNMREKLFNFIRLVFFFLSIACLYGVLTIWGYMLGFIKFLVYPSYLLPRLYGTATEPQSFAGFLIPIVLIALWAFTQKKPRFLDYLSAFFVFLAFIMTFSVGALGGAIIGGILFVALNSKRLNRLFYLRFAAMFVLVLFVAMVVNSGLWPGYARAFSAHATKIKVWRVAEELKVVNKNLATEEGISIFNEKKVNIFDDKVTRLWMAQTAWNMFKSHPIVGVGPGNYGFLYNSYKPLNSPLKDYIEKTHNVYLQILAENGLPGFLLFMGLVTFLLLQSFKKWFFLKDNNSKLVLAVLICGFVGVLINGLSYGILQHSHTWIVMGLLLSANEVL